MDRILRKKLKHSEEYCIMIAAKILPQVNLNFEK